MTVGMDKALHQIWEDQDSSSQWAFTVARTKAQWKITELMWAKVQWANMALKSWVRNNQNKTKHSTQVSKRVYA
jgi:uncharacterized membrane protein YciS (DUF1049 family)